MQDLTKAMKRKLCELAGEAYEAELQRDLNKLDESFAEWRAGKIDCWKLSDRIHKFQDGPSRELFKRYNYLEPSITVPHARVKVILREDEIPPKVMQHIQMGIEFFRREQRQKSASGH